MRTLFITGASGFIGSHLVRRLNPSDYKNIYYLSRTARDGLSYLREYNNVHFLSGSLFDDETYIHHLSKSDVVIHLAAITGKAKREEYFNINAKGTDFLLEQCKRSGRKKFLFISSIAVKFKNIKNYPYAQSKLEAEQNVKASGIPYTILRPTIVIGDGSPTLMNLSKLANAFIVPIFDNGSTLIQPIFIEDLISQILYIIKNDIFNNEILDLGGPEQISVANFIKILNKLSHNRHSLFIHVPIGPVIKTLEFIERHFYAVLPFTAGQLSSFSNDGTIDKNWLFDRYLLNMKNVNEMLQFVFSSVMKIGKSKENIKQECIRFTKYLINCKPNAYIEKKYIKGHKRNLIENNMGPFDTFLIKVTNKNTFIIRLADVYTTVFYRKAVLRKKLILLLAVLESCPTTYSKIDSVTGDSKISLFIETIQKVLFFLVLLFISSIVLFPIQMMFYLRSLQLKKIL
ncbi:MAG: NAD-dependent epimerase/dehydratase family protein [Candidatus Hodarchaeota archaeon]